MQYRKFGKHDFKVSSLGFGCMRFPTIDGDEGKIDEVEATKMLRYAIDNGVNYIDTAYPYHKKASETFVGKALRDGYREKIRLATKLPVWLTSTYEDFDKYINEQLKNLQTDYIDFYLLHALDKETWNTIKNLGVLNFLDNVKKSGKIKYAGFSYHDEGKNFKEIVDAYDWDFCQIQYNFMDENYQAGKEGLEYLASKNIAVIIMEPLRGGRLTKNPPEEIKKIWDTSETKRSPANWALSWIWNHPEVTCILSGMSTMKQVEENIEIAETALPNSLTQEELQIVDKVKEKYISFTKINCTGCNYCMPCPADVDIPGNFSLYNEAFMYNEKTSSSTTYNRFMDEKNRASNCVECGKCESACPQNISIRKELKKVHELLKW